MDKTKEKGIKALNQEYTKYDQVKKEQAYHLAESSEDQFDNDYEIKTCDLSHFFHGGEKVSKNLRTNSAKRWQASDL